jgi:hypothetical protein
VFCGSFPFFVTDNLNRPFSNIKNVKPLFYTLLLAFSTSLSAQDFSAIDARARAVPFPEKQNITLLAAALTKDLKSEKEKARAVFAWVTEHISYDVKSFENREELDIEVLLERGQPQEVLRRKKAVCAGYANLFTALCQSAGLQALTVTGKTKNFRGAVARTNHAWNLVRADGEWGFVDATWGAGDVDTDEGKYTRNFKPRFFFPSPEAMLKDHFPDDPLFQNLSKPIDFESFKKKTSDAPAPQSATKEPLTFASPTDSLDHFVALDSTSRAHSTIERALRFDPNNNEMLYKMGLLQFNESVQFFNEYIRENNQRVLSKTPPTVEAYDQNIRSIQAAKSRIEAAQGFLSRVTAGGQYSPKATQLRAIANKRLGEVQEALERNQNARSQLQKPKKTTGKKN